MKLKTWALATAMAAMACAPAFADQVGYQIGNGNTNTQAVDSAHPLPVAMAPYLSSQTPETAASGNVANTAAVATLAASAGKTTYITGFQCTATGSTAAAVVNVTVAGVITGTMTYTFVFPAGVTTLATPLNVTFSNPVPASAANTTIAVTLPAGTAGNTNEACNAQGFQQ